MKDMKPYPHALEITEDGSFRVIQEDGNDYLSSRRNRGRCDAYDAAATEKEPGEKGDVAGRW